MLDLANARDPDAFDRAIDVRVTRIRKKIEPDPSNPVSYTHLTLPTSDLV